MGALCNSLIKKNKNKIKDYEENLNTNILRKTTTIKDNLEKLFQKGAIYYNKIEEE
jgi:hypothetical protein